MVILAAKSSGRSFNCRRLLIGIKILEAPFSIAISTTATGLKMVSMEPPRFRPPAIAKPPLMLFCRRDEQSATSTATPTAEPVLAASKARSWTENSWCGLPGPAELGAVNPDNGMDRPRSHRVNGNAAEVQLIRERSAP
jgi:hypothetical protein